MSIKVISSYDLNYDNRRLATDIDLVLSKIKSDLKSQNQVEYIFTLILLKVKKLLFQHRFNQWFFQNFTVLT